jgi:hypothetical protein
MMLSPDERARVEQKAQQQAFQAAQFRQQVDPLGDALMYAVPVWSRDDKAFLRSIHIRPE